MAQKFGRSRWVKEGFLDNREPGCVVGRVTFAAIGTVDFYLKGDCRGEIAGKAIRFRNGGFEEDEVAGEVLGDFEIPQVGEVSLISFDPHPNLSPHPYIEWFSALQQHYRIELAPEDAWVLSDEEAALLNDDSAAIRHALASRVSPTRAREGAEWP